MVLPYNFRGKERGHGLKRHVYSPLGFDSGFPCTSGTLMPNQTIAGASPSTMDLDGGMGFTGEGSSRWEPIDIDEEASKRRRVFSRLPTANLNKCRPA